MDGEKNRMVGEGARSIEVLSRRLVNWLPGALSSGSWDKRPFAVPSIRVILSAVRSIRSGQPLITPSLVDRSIVRILDFQFSIN